MREIIRRLPEKAIVPTPGKKTVFFSNIRMCAGLDSETLIPLDVPDLLTGYL
jgi:hypothetical protein